MSDITHKLTELFTNLPGVGPRQARRFVSYILSRDESYAKELIKKITEIKKEVTQCSECYRYFNHQGKYQVCLLCRDESKDTKKLVVVEKDVDLDAVKKVEGMNCRYFVLGGLVPLTERETPYVRVSELVQKIKKYAMDDLEEVIIALSASPAGDHTVEILRDKISQLLSINDIKISTLGRGLSTGTELEYSDTDTLREAIQNRK